MHFFKKGDLVRITSNTSFHNLKINEIVQLTRVEKRNSFWALYAGTKPSGGEWFFTEDDCEPINGTTNNRNSVSVLFKEEKR